MPQLRLARTWIRNKFSSFYARGPVFWTITLLIALLVPSPIAAPILYARLRRDPSRPLTPGAP